jgi:hypothetical protein
VSKAKPQQSQNNDGGTHQGAAVSRAVVFPNVSNMLTAVGIYGPEFLT